ncbi:MAG: IclR family transcriptional regulator [Sphingomonas sp.]
MVKSADRVIDVLECIAAAGGLSFAEIGTRLDIPNSSLFYLLGTLSRRGYVQQEGGRGKYLLGPAFSALAGTVEHPVSWVETIRPLVDAVWTTVRETTSYFEPRGDEVECVISKLAPRSLIPVHTVGQRAPLYVFSGGKLVLAEMDDRAFESYLKRTPLERFTPHTLTTPEALREEIAQVRVQGYALSREEHTRGVVGLSVALKHAGAIVGTSAWRSPRSASTRTRSTRRGSRSSRRARLRRGQRGKRAARLIRAPAHGPASLPKAALPVPFAGTPGPSVPKRDLTLPDSNALIREIDTSYI